MTADLLADLTEPQKQAVMHTDGPLLVLAGAGSGKTRVITRRVAHLIRQGVAPWRIAAITFTNKAAGEMRERVSALTSARGIAVGTFHSLCARLLREHASEAGLSANYTIFDTADRRKVIKDAVSKLNLDSSTYAAASVESAISHAKNKLVGPEEYARHARDLREREIARIYRVYQEMMAAHKGLDFDDLLMIPAVLLQQNEDLRGRLEQRFTHVLIDEYQDTNHAQYVFARLMTKTRRNLAVVGDPDQSIYAWRGADLNNILQFETDYPEAAVIRLEQNYRSTQTILRAADELISRNIRRKPKALWTQNEPGGKVKVIRCSSEYQEAEQIAHVVADEIRRGRKPGEIAVFYRVNSLTRVIENALRSAQVPYELVRGVEFYNRAEIKDALSYLRVIANPDDGVSLERILNTPPRGIGETTIKKVTAFAAVEGVSLMAALRRAREGGAGRAAPKIAEFLELLDSLQPRPNEKVRDLLDRVLMKSRLWHHYADQDTEEDQRTANLGELLTAAAEYDAAEPEGGLNGFLSQASLTGDQDGYDPEAGKVTMMTLHAAKGLEFPVVVIAGLEQGLLPHQRSIDSADIEEERRLFFVGITRAMKQLYVTHAMSRMARGEPQRQLPSDFLQELPRSAIESVDLTYGRGFGGRDEDGDGGDYYIPPRERAGVRKPFAPPSRFGPGSRGPLAPPPAKPPTGAGERRVVPDGDGPPEYAVGMRVRHPTFGIGHITSVEPGTTPRLRIRFNQVGEKTIVVGYVRLEMV
jgi:DNA helicase-2/ATP-dependent DNA helicase PcrA